LAKVSPIGAKPARRGRPEVRGGEDARHARQGSGRGRVDAGDPGVGDRRADEKGMERAFGGHVGNELAVPRDEPRILPPPNSHPKDRTLHLHGRKGNA